MQTGKLKCAAAVIMVLCILTLAAPAQAADRQLQNWMRSNNVVSKLVRLDRADGFCYGLSIKQPGAPDLLIAPGAQKQWLLQIDGAEAVLKADAAGVFQVIAASEDVMVWVCWLKQLTTYLTNVQTCTTFLCRADRFLTLLIGLNACVPVDTQD